MSTRKRRDPRSLEPEAPEMYAAPAPPPRHRPVAGQKPPTLDEALASVALTVGVRLIERLLTPPPSPMSASTAEAVGQSAWLRANGNVVKRCTKCPASLLVPLAWIWCPLCGEPMGAVS